MCSLYASFSKTTEIIQSYVHDGKECSSYLFLCKRLFNVLVIQCCQTMRMERSSKRRKAAAYTVSHILPRELIVKISTFLHRSKMTPWLQLDRPTGCMIAYDRMRRGVYKDSADLKFMQIAWDNRTLRQNREYQDVHFNQPLANEPETLELDELLRFCTRTGGPCRSHCNRNPDAACFCQNGLACGGELHPEALIAEKHPLNVNELVRTGRTKELVLATSLFINVERESYDHFRFHLLNYCLSELYFRSVACQVYIEVENDRLVARMYHPRIRHYSDLQSIISPLVDPKKFQEELSDLAESRAGRHFAIQHAPHYTRQWQEFISRFHWEWGFFPVSCCENVEDLRNKHNNVFKCRFVAEVESVTHMIRSAVPDCCKFVSARSMDPRCVPCASYFGEPNTQPLQ